MVAQRAAEKTAEGNTKEVILSKIGLLNVNLDMKDP